MREHNLIVIGSSAGGVEALHSIISKLPADLPAPIFVVQHIPSHSPSMLTDILNRVSHFMVEHPEDGAVIQPGHVYVAPPDRHLVIEDGHIHIVRGPKENGFRPAIDALFRTAARAYGPRVIGLILTGMLDDGTAGLMAIKRHGGRAIVQDPLDAAFPDMPLSALRYVNVDEVCRLDELPGALTHLAYQKREESNEAMPTADEFEPIQPPESLEISQQLDQPGANSAFSCPDCGGVLIEFYDGNLLRFRCQVGHTYSPESMLENQVSMLDRSMWAAYRSINERIHLLEHLSQDAKSLKDTLGMRRFNQLIHQAQAQRQMIYSALMKDDSAEHTQ